MTDPRKALARLQEQMQRHWERHEEFSELGQHRSARAQMEIYRDLEAHEAWLLAEIKQARGTLEKAR